ALDQFVLSVSANVLFDPADFNADGVVDGNDLLVWQDHFGVDNATSHAQGDATGDGLVDGADFLAWQRQLTPGAGAPEQARQVPEPAAAVGAWLAAAAAWSASRSRAAGRRQER
ncbi:MAG TPA: hypothetical protein PJ982_17035, partial [Lacipirellulaceae bacterium]|nr:hypothetical protein [Lacipirellulaceae bacterium]